MTPEQIEAILESNAKAIAANSDAIAEGRKQTQAQIAESQRQIEALYQLNAELIRDRATMLEILRGLNEDRIRTSENLASLAENVARIANARFAARRVEGQGRTQAVSGGWWGG